MTSERIIQVHLRNIDKHPIQKQFIKSTAKRKGIRAGRRGGKTVGASQLACEAFLAEKRVLYATPTEDQIQAFWFEVKRAFAEPIDAGIYNKNETIHAIEFPGTKQRIRAKTAYNADTLRGDYADLLILDEFQLMAEDALNLVGLPMLADNNGDLVIIYTPPSLSSRSRSKAKDPQYAAKLFKKYKERQESGDAKYAVWHFSSFENPYISKDALGELAEDMSSIAYRMEIMAEDIEEAPGALWRREWIDKHRIDKVPPTFKQIVVGVDPSATSGGDEAGIVVAGWTGWDYYILDDVSIQGSPKTWASRAIEVYHRWKANTIVAESNNGGEMVSTVIQQIDPLVPVTLVHASRGKQTRAEPISALAEKGKIHHVGAFDKLEDELCLWVPGDASPNRLDAMVWAVTALMTSHAKLSPDTDVMP